MQRMKAISGWKLSAESRDRLLAVYAPAYPDLDADHVTLAGGDKGLTMPSQAVAQVVGEADDGRGVQALVVRLNGTTDRPDGSTYHITWSLDRAAGREPGESNDVIRDCGWTACEPVEIGLTPSIWRS